MYTSGDYTYLLVPTDRLALLGPWRSASALQPTGSYTNPLLSSGGQPALGTRNTTLVLRQYLPALNISLELSLGPRRCAGDWGRVYAPRAGCCYRYPRPSVSRALRWLFSSLHPCLVEFELVLIYHREKHPDYKIISDVGCVEPLLTPCEVTTSVD